MPKKTTIVKAANAGIILPSGPDVEAAKPLDQQLALAEVGGSGLKRWAGIIDEEFLKELRGTRGVNVFRQMSDNDDVVGASLLAYRGLMLGAEAKIEKGGDAPEDDERQEFVRQCLFDDMSNSWPEFMEDAFSFLNYGWSYFEVVYKIRGGDSTDPTRKSRYTDGKIGIRKLAIRAQETLRRWQFDESGGIQGMVQAPPPTYDECTVPISKALLFRTSTFKNNPEGRSILRNAYRPWYFKNNMQTIEGIGVERDLAGYPYIKIADGGPDIWNTNDTNAVTLKATLERIVRGIRRDEQEGAILPWWANLELLSGNSKRNFDTSAIITRYDTRIAMSMLTDFVLLGHDQVGTQALSVSKIDILGLAVAGLLSKIESVINRFLIPSLLKLNNMSTEDAPVLRFGRVERVNLAELADYISKLAGAGVPLFPNIDLEQYLLQIAHLPTPHAEGGPVDSLKEDEQAIRAAELSAQRRAAEMRASGEIPAPGEPAPDAGNDPPTPGGGKKPAKGQKPGKGSKGAGK